MAHLTAAFCEEYLRTFHVRLVENDQMRREAHRLRHQVYAVENGFEPPNPEQIERDAYDDRAPHALLYHRAFDEPLGTVRLVLPDRHRAAGSLPLHTVCPPRVLSAAELPPERTGEISRFALSKMRFQRLLQSSRQDTPGQDDHRRVLSFACLGLITAVRQIARANGITHVAAVMKPALLRRLESLGLSFHRLHEPVDFHGLRIPCFTPIEQLEAHVQRQRPDLWAFSEGTPDGLAAAA
jgi:N-acyl amino acid synthase of PEP-CTERM/exosortase system